LAVEVVVIWYFYVENRYVPMDNLFDGDDVAPPTNTKMEKAWESGKGFTTSVYIEGVD
jgi:hypothetical protein